MALIYKILGAADWRAAETAGVFGGSGIDLSDGYIHFSTAAQAPETAAKWFSGRDDLMLVAVETETLGSRLRWEISRGGQRFPISTPNCRFLRSRGCVRCRSQPTGVMISAASRRDCGARRAGAPASSRAAPRNGAPSGDRGAQARQPVAPDAKKPDPQLAARVFGLDFPHPIGLAAGFDKNAEAADGALACGFSFVEVGTLTPRPQAGNPMPRLFRLSADAALVNRMGFNNAGYAAGAKNFGPRGCAASSE